MSRPLLAGALLCVMAAVPGAAQPRYTVQTAALFESYTFDPGLGFESVREFTVPVVVGLRLGSRSDLTLASGYAQVEMSATDVPTPSPSLTGPLDTEARLAVTLVEERLRLLLTGAVPTGTGTLAEADAVILGPLSNDILGFAAPTLGTGGAVGVGFAGALPAGRASVGFGLTYRVPLSFEPVLGTGDEVRAGNEVRARLGLETPVGRRSFLRVAGVLSTRAADEFNGVQVNGVGNRLAAYAALDTPLGPTVATVWASGMVRSDPSLEATAVGAAFVPRGTLFSGGGRLVIGLGADTRLEPSVELRTGSVAPDAAGLELEKLGDVVRFGTALRRRAREGAWFVLEGQGALGTVWSGGESVGVQGFRVSVRLEWSR